jgi:hypothetical protein
MGTAEAVEGHLMQGKTVTKTPFEYSGSLLTGLTIFFKPPSKMNIPVETINIIRQEITKRSPVRMGASRNPLVADSVGETQKVKHKQSPQVMSYVLPLLMAEGFCTVSGRKPFVIHKL